MNKITQKFRKAVFIVAYAKTKEGIKYLVLKRKFHWRGWEFPKGGIDKNETKKETVRREILEETGQKPLSGKVKKFNFHGKYKYKRKFPDREGIIGQEYSLFAVEIKYKKIKFDKLEHSEYKWLNFEDAVKKVTFRNQKKSLKIVNNWLENEKEKNKF